MSRYEHDPTQVVAALTVLPKDDYEFVLGKPKAFERTAKAGHQSYGIRIPMKVVGGPEDGKKTVYTLYLHSEGAQQMAKRFQMAAAGYSGVNERTEKKFDSEVGEKDWSYDPESGEIGNGWAEYEGLHLCCDVDQEPLKDADTKEPVKDKTTGEVVMSQTWGTWRPLEPAEV